MERTLSSRWWDESWSCRHWVSLACGRHTSMAAGSPTWPASGSNDMLFSRIGMWERRERHNRWAS